MLILANEPDLNRAGWEYLAGGCYGRVHEHKAFPDLVVKTGSDADGCKFFLEWCMLNQDMRGVPQIRTLVGLPGGRFMVVMKRYRGMQHRRATDSGDTHPVMHVTQDPWQGCTDYMEGAGLIPHEQRWPSEYLPGEAWFKGRNEYCRWPMETQMKTYMTVQDFATAGHGYAKDVVDKFEADTGLDANDLHHGNIMWCDATQSIIITDPIASICDHDDGSPYTPDTMRESLPRPDFELVHG